MDIARNREQRVRRQALKADLRLCKARGRETLDNFGGYALVDCSSRCVIFGSRYELSLDDASELIAEALA